MASTIPRLDLLLRHASGPRRVAPLLRALGFGPRLAAVPPAALAAYGLGEEPGVASLALAGERGGLVALLVALSEGAGPDAVARLARRVRGHNPARPYLFLFAGPGFRRLVFASFGLGEELRQLVVERRQPRRTDLEALEELAARDDEGGVALALRHARALDRTRVTRQFFRDFKAQRGLVAARWLGPPGDAVPEREQLALLLLCRLMFLYFLQREGHLAGDAAYLPGLFRQWRRRPGEGSFYRAVLEPLFFGALNTRPERREPAARALGPLPYLNGGLFERHALERRCAPLDLPDDVVAGIFEELLERYRFTTREAADAAAAGAGEVGVDPEMLGRVFEGLMAADRRGASGTFYTPAAVVDRLVREALEAHLTGRAGLTASAAAALVGGEGAATLAPETRRALARELGGLRILDPACGSGAFLVGALGRLSRLRASLGGDAREIRREIVGQTLHGVDVQDDAALLCALRLWLALAVEPEGGGTNGATPVPPLPNLDRRIRQGDALVDPIDLTAGGEAGPDPWRSAGAVPEVRRALRVIAPLAGRYLSAEPQEKPALQRTLAAAEAELARAWIDALDRRLAARLAERRAEALSRDLFGEPPPGAPRAEAACAALASRRGELGRLRASLEDAGALPFFSFGIHFAETAAEGFDLVLSNPPWIRAHRWPAALGRLVRQRYAVCRDPGWRPGAALAGAPCGVAAQVDLSLLFLERSLRLLAPGGTLAMLLPAKALRSLYGAGARRMLLEEAVPVAVEDHSLDQRSIFRADAFAAAVVARKRGVGEDRSAGGAPARGAARDPAPPGVRITMIRRGLEPLRFALPPEELPVVRGDPASPWLLAPPAARSALRRMQAAGPPLGTYQGVRVHRGVVTGANDVLVVREAAPKLGGLAWVRAEGYRRARREGRDATEARRFQAIVEAAALRPLVRGSGISAWRFGTSGHLLWVHDDASAEAAPPPPRAGCYLARHAATLRSRSGWRPALPAGALFRVSPATLAPKVAWHDLAANLKAVALPARVRGLSGAEVPLVPLNTVYFIATASDEEALLLAAILNSTPVRTFARAVAERAKDARFRFLAWTVALLPLPPAWGRGPGAARLLRLSREAHRQGALDGAGEAELDSLVAAAYGLGPADVEALFAFDRWLRGVS